MSSVSCLASLLVTRRHGRLPCPVTRVAAYCWLPSSAASLSSLSRFPAGRVSGSGLPDHDAMGVFPPLVHQWAPTLRAGAATVEGRRAPLSTPRQCRQSRLVYADGL